LGYLGVLARSLYYSFGRIRARFVEYAERMLIWDCCSSVSYVFLETYVQAMASLAYVRQVECVACQLINSPFIVGRNVVVF